MKNKVYCEKKEKYRIAFSAREKADYFIKHYEQFMGWGNAGSFRELNGGSSPEAY